MSFAGAAKKPGPSLSLRSNYRHVPAHEEEGAGGDGDHDDDDCNDEIDTSGDREGTTTELDHSSSTDGGAQTTTGVVVMREVMTVDEFIEEVLGAGPFQTRILVVAGLCFASDAIQVMLLSFLGIVLQEEWGLSPTSTAFLTSLLFVGALLGTLVLGPLADSVGRRTVFLVSTAAISVFGALMATAASYWALSTVIFLVGTGIGGLTIPFDVLAEVLPASHRGEHLLMIEYFWTLGVLYVVVLAYLFLDLDGYASTSEVNPQQPPDRPWRMFTALCACPCAISLVAGYCVVPESPRWLATRGRMEEAMTVLEHAAESNRRPRELFDNVQIQSPGRVEQEKHTSFLQLLHPRWRETTLRLWGAWAGFSFGYYGAMLLTTKAFSEEGSTTAESPSGRSIDYAGIFISSCAELVGTTLVIVTVDRFGRIPLQVICYTTAGIAVCLLAVASHRPGILAAGFVARVFEMAATCTTWVSTAEIYPTDMRTTGHGYSNAMARIGAFASPYVIQGASRNQIGASMLLVHLFTAACVSTLPETAGVRLSHDDEPSCSHGYNHATQEDGDEVLAGSPNRGIAA